MATSHYSSCDTINDVARRLVKAGWELVGGTKHRRLRSPDGKLTITVPVRPSDHRATKNWLSQIRRAGVEIPS
jgi:predicted RNA binding protein YcfA (HicA-like mRNA interferase family)